MPSKQGSQTSSWRCMSHLTGAAPTERSVQFMNLVLQGGRGPPRLAHPFGHDVPLWSQAFGFRACGGGESTRHAGLENTLPHTQPESCGTSRCIHVKIFCPLVAPLNIFTAAVDLPCSACVLTDV